MPSTSVVVQAQLVAIMIPTSEVTELLDLLIITTYKSWPGRVVRDILPFCSLHYDQSTGLGLLELARENRSEYRALLDPLVSHSLQEPIYVKLIYQSSTETFIVKPYYAFRYNLWLCVVSFAPCYSNWDVCEYAAERYNVGCGKFGR